MDSHFVHGVNCCTRGSVECLRLSGCVVGSYHLSPLSPSCRFDPVQRIADACAATSQSDSPGRPGSLKEIRPHLKTEFQCRTVDQMSAVSDLRKGMRKPNEPPLKPSTGGTAPASNNPETRSKVPSPPRATTKSILDDKVGISAGCS